MSVERITTKNVFISCIDNVFISQRIEQELKTKIIRKVEMVRF